MPSDLVEIIAYAVVGPSGRLTNLKPGMAWLIGPAATLELGLNPGERLVEVSVVYRPLVVTQPTKPATRTR